MAAIGAVFVGGKGAPQGNDGRAEHREVLRRDVNALHLLRMIAARDVQSGAAEIERGDLLENARLLTP